MRQSAALLVLYALIVSVVLPSGIARAQEVPSREIERERRDNLEPNKNESNKQITAADKENGKPDGDEDEDDADLPRIARGKISRGDYLQARGEQINLWRGFPYPNADVRNQAVYQMMREEIALRKKREAVAQKNGLSKVEVDPAWKYLGPSPIPNGSYPVSGRTTAIAVHPTNPDIAYVGTAQGGLYRTLNGGSSWTPLMDNALSLAIGAVTISPTDPTTVFVGTGEPNLSGDSFFGVGLYRITNADSANPIVAGPLRFDASGNDVFTGRAISKIIVSPTDSNLIFVSTTSGTCGTGGCAGQPLPNAGIYRATNALAGSPTFTRLNAPNAAATGGIINRNVTDMVIEPDNADNLTCWVRGTAGQDLGIWRTTNATAATPTFTQTYVGNTSGVRGLLALQKSGSTVTIVAVTGENPDGVAGNEGKAVKSTDGGLTFPTVLTNANGFCKPQCFYDLAVAIDQTDANKVYIAGAPNTVFKRSSDGGTTFAASSTGLHVDSHAIAIAPSNPNVIYFGSDGGIYRSLNGGTTWTSLNNSTFAATQFQSLALHPTDPNYTLGGTQDNGTQLLASDGATVIYSDGGDGGYVQIDQNATTPTNVTAYHTYYNSTNSLIGFTRADSTVSNGDPNWNGFYGCGGTANGISCTDSTMFYAPLVLGPGNPNTVYFGSDRLYRSANKGVTMSVVSPAPIVSGATISTIAVSPQNDNVRVVGLTNGKIYATTTGANVVDVTSSAMPARFVGRAKVDPNNQNTAYVTFNGYAVASGAHVWKTTNLNAAAPTWTIAGSGIPDVPVNSFAIDPANSNNLFAGTDIGVFRSTDAGASWQPFGTGLPRVAVFDMDVQKVKRVLRIATHGRGFWEIPIDAAAVSKRARADFDGDGKTDLSVFRPSNGTWYAQQSTNGFTAAQFGQNGDKLVPGDYDGDGKTDFAVTREVSGSLYFYVLNSRTNTFTGRQWGTAGDIPVVGDFNGDKRDDYAVFRPSNGTWYVQPSDGSALIYAQFGKAGDIPAPGDYDGDGKTDFAVFRSGTWYVLSSQNGTFSGTQFGLSTDLPVAGDYDGDGKTDVAVFRPSNGTWYVNGSRAGFTAAQFGLSGDVPAAGDFDGDGRDDFAVYRGNTWYILRSRDGFTAAQFGTTGDLPVPAAYNPQN